jgi:hypothetical protein
MLFHNASGISFSRRLGRDKRIFRYGPAFFYTYRYFKLGRIDIRHYPHKKSGDLYFIIPGIPDPSEFNIVLYNRRLLSFGALLRENMEVIVSVILFSNLGSLVVAYLFRYYERRILILLKYKKRKRERDKQKAPGPEK